MPAAAPEIGVLLLAYGFPPSSASGALRPGRFARYLTRFGYRAHIVASPVAGGVQPPFARWTAPSGGVRSPTFRLDHLLWRMLHRVMSPYDDRLPWVPHALSASAELLREQEVAILFSTFPPLAAHVTALLLKRRTGLPWVADFRDPLFGNPFRRGWRAALHDRWIERSIMNSADWVIANTEPMAQSLCRRYPQHCAKVRLIPNGYDPEAAPEPFAIPPRSHRVLAHVGTIYGGRHPVRFLESLNRLIEQRRVDPKRIRVELTGNIEPTDMPMSGPLFSSLDGLGCLAIDARRVSREEALKRIGLADYLLLLDLNSADTGLQIPAKLFDYVLVGRPILAFTNPGSPTAGILERSGVPYRCLLPTDPDDHVDRVVEQFVALPTEPVRCSSWFLQTFSALAQTEQLARDLDALLGRAQAASQPSTMPQSAVR